MITLSTVGRLKILGYLYVLSGLIYLGLWAHGRLSSIVTTAAGLGITVAGLVIVIAIQNVESAPVDLAAHLEELG